MIRSRVMPLREHCRSRRSGVVTICREFVELPFRLHAGTPWIPPLKLERYAYLKPAAQPVLQARRRRVLPGTPRRACGRPRSAPSIDRNFNDFHGNRWGFFGFLEFEDDQEMLDALLDAAADWLKAARPRPHDRPVMTSSINEECGVLIEGFELRADDPPALASALLPAAGRGGGPRQGDGRVPLGPAARTIASSGCCRSCRSWPSGRTTGTGSPSARCRSGGSAVT